jgi:hypothetical protein
MQILSLIKLEFLRLLVLLSYKPTLDHLHPILVLLNIGNVIESRWIFRQNMLFIKFKSFLFHQGKPFGF